MDKNIKNSSTKKRQGDNKQKSTLIKPSQNKKYPEMDNNEEVKKPLEITTVNSTKFINNYNSKVQDEDSVDQDANDDRSNINS